MGHCRERSPTSCRRGIQSRSTSPASFSAMSSSLPRRLLSGSRSRPGSSRWTGWMRLTRGLSSGWRITARSVLDALSYAGSEVSGGYVIPGLVGAVVIISAFQRRWLLAGFVLAAIVLESATYRATVFFVDRQRPDVARLEGLPVDASFPSGHVAASIAVYFGFALLLTSRMTSTRAKVLVWAVALAIPPIVAASRDVPGNAPSARHARRRVHRDRRLALALLVARVTGVVARRREARCRMSTVARASRTPARPWAADCSSCAGSSSSKESPTRCGTRCRRAARRRSGCVRRSTRVPTSSSSGAATAWCSGASTRSTARAPRSRSSPPARRTCSRRTSRSRRTSSRRSTSACTGRAESSTSGG